MLLVNHKPTWRPHHELEREQQAVTMANSISDILAERDLPVLLVGDLDAEPEAASIRFWAGRQSLQGVSVGFRDAWHLRHPDDPGYTFSNTNAMKALRWGDDIDRRIDYIFVSCDDHGPRYAIEACDLIFDQAVDGVWASDHIGLYADLIGRVQKT
jgi:endonuclease/exonuclease/phosphatase family metal-dependent hydrolase